MSQDGKRNSDSIASKLIGGGVPSNLDGLRFNAALNIWEFAPFGGAGAAIWYAGGGQSNPSTSIVANFIPTFSSMTAEFTTENKCIVEIFNAITVTSFGTNCETNTKATDSSLRLRDDAVDVPNTIVTITGSTTGWFEVTGISEVIAAGSQVATQKLGTAAGSLRFQTTLARLNL